MNSKNPTIVGLKELGIKVAKEYGMAKELTEAHLKSQGLNSLHKDLAIPNILQAQAGLVELFPFKGENTFKGLAQNPLGLGVYCFLKYGVGTKLLKTQTECPQHSAFVPLVLQAYKTYSSIPYSAWEDKLVNHVSPQLAKAVAALGSVPAPVYTPEYLKERAMLKDIYNRSISTKSNFNPVTKVTNFKNAYATCMYWQTWLAHPELIHSDMLFSFSDPDKIPEPCVKVEPMLVVPKVEKEKVQEAIPDWMQ